MSTEKLEYTREWTDENAFPLLGFTRNWENPEDYPTYEPDEMQVRQDMQSLHDETKDFINNELIPRVLADEATEEARNRAEAARVEAEQARAQAETKRAEAEITRATAEQGRVSAEAARDLWEEYNGTHSYVPGNKVAYGGSSYVNVKACTAVTPENGEYWLLIAGRGKDGNDGLNGSDAKGDMLKSVYDPQGKRRDVFGYADAAAEQVSKDVTALGKSLETLSKNTAPLVNGKVPEQYLPDRSSEDGSSLGLDITQTTDSTTIKVHQNGETESYTIPHGKDGQNGKDGVGVPAGGAAGQMLVKKSGTDYDTEWENVPESAKAYELPVASSTVLGGVKPVPKTTEMTESVGVDEFGHLWVLPRTVAEEAEDAKTTGINFTNWESGGFVVTMSDGTNHNGTVTFDSEGKPTSVTLNGHTLSITLPA